MGNKESGLPPFLRGMLAGTLAGAALAGFNHLSEEASEGPQPVLGGNLEQYTWRLGSIAYHVDGPEEGEPLLLLHGIYASASNFEFRKPFDFFARQGYRVYAPDLLGFGLSAHPAIDYTDDLYVDLIEDFAQEVIGDRASVMASTLSCSFVTATAARRPELFGHLVLIEPVGLEQLDQQIPVAGDLLYALIKSPVVGEALFNLLTSPPSLRYFLDRQGYFDASHITEELVTYHYNVSHQPNARYAPGAFISGFLNHDVREAWRRLENPVLLAWGYQAETVPVERATEFLRLNGNAIIRGYDANLLPHDEQAEGFNQDVLDWLQGRLAQ